MTVPCAEQRFDDWTSFSGNHSAFGGVDTHDRLALICKAVRIYTNGFVKHNTLHSFFICRNVRSLAEMRCKGTAIFLKQMLLCSNRFVLFCYRARPLFSACDDVPNMAFGQPKVTRGPFIGIHKSHSLFQVLCKSGINSFVASLTQCNRFFTCSYNILLLMVKHLSISFLIPSIIVKITCAG